MRRKIIKERRDDGEGGRETYWVVHEFRRVLDEDATEEIEIRPHYDAEFLRAGGVTNAINEHVRQIEHLQDIAVDIQHMKDNGLDVYERGGVVKA